MIGRFIFGLSVFLAALWSTALLALAIFGTPAAPGAYGNIAIIGVVGDVVVLGLGASFAWVFGAHL